MARSTWAMWIATAMLTMLAMPLNAQTASITGRVVESSSEAPLPNAMVEVDGTGIRVLTDVDGTFSLRRVPTGSQTVTVSFLGYSTARQQVTVAANSSATVNFALDPQAIALDELVVYGEATRGQAKALQQQKTATTITSVVSEELFNRFPDRNAAETVRRLPGISVSRDQGEAEFVQIRGIDQEFNSLTVNGVRIPAPDGDDGIRSVGLDLINNNLLGEIEVVKALTPDMDADAVGGVVNFGLRKAPMGGTARFSGGYGLNNQTSDFETYGRGIGEMAGVVGQRFGEDRFGLLLDGAFYRTQRHSKLKEMEYDDEDGSIDELIFAQHTNDYDVQRQRFGFSATSDYQANPDSRLYLTGSYNVYLDDEVRRIAEFRLDDLEETRETRNRLEDQRVGMVMGGGEHQLGPLGVDYRAAWIRSSEDMPDRTYLRYQRDNDFAGFTNSQIRDFDGTTTFAGLAPLELNRIRYDDKLNQDEDLSGQLNLTLPFGMARGVSSFKFGGKALRKNASLESVRHQMTRFTRADVLSEGTFGYENVRFDGAELAPLLTDWGGPRDINEDYSATEDVMAAYGMATLNLTPKFTAVGGVRYERTTTDFYQPNPETEAIPLSGGGEYDNVIPSVHLTFRPDDRSNIRAAWWNGLARPRYQELIPRRIVDEEERSIRYGNPDLEPRTAQNFDLMFERFTSGLGVVGLGAFYKQFKAFHTTRVFREDVAGVPFEARQTVMGDGTATYWGLEFSFNQRLAFLGGIAQDFSIFGNYNYTHSEGEVDGRTLPLTNSPEHIGNLSLLYDNARRGLSFVVATNYRAPMLIGIGGASHRDVYLDEEFNLDLSVAKTMSRQLSISAQLNGLTARQEREMLGDPSQAGARVLQWEEYGPYGTVNLTYRWK